jgi:hypothetical protein
VVKRFRTAATSVADKTLVAAAGVYRGRAALLDVVGGGCLVAGITVILGAGAGLMAAGAWLTLRAGVIDKDAKK